jgi:hypothetical protein
MAQFGFIKVTVQGGDSTSGAINLSAPDLKVGDRLLLSYAPNPIMENIISTDGQVVQSAFMFDWSTRPPFDLIYLRGL